MGPQKAYVGIDIDGVLADYVSGLLDYYNKKYGTNHAPDHITDYAMHRSLNKERDEFYSFVQDFEQRFIDKLNPVEGAIEGVRELSKSYNIVVITARPTWLYSKTKRWLDENLGINYKLEFAKTSVNKGLKTKAEICSHYRASFHVEDAPHHALDCAEVTTVLLKDTSYNKEVKHRNIKRVNSWDEIIEECLVKAP